MSKVVVLLSGGIDSTVCLADAVERFGAENVGALTLFYGQKHAKELQSAKAVARHLGVNHIIQDLAEVFKFDNNPLLAGSTEKVSEGDYATQQREANGMVKTYVPFRNGLFLSYATAIAYSLGAQWVIYGAHADDAAGNAYPDCSLDFYTAMDRAIYVGTGQKVQLFAPLINKFKKDIVKRGLELNAPFHLTWSCYNGTEKACGKCGTCIDRKKAFEANGVEDPIDYAE